MESSTDVFDTTEEVQPGADLDQTVQDDSRRKLIRNAAWAIPVIAVAVAAPAAAASDGGPTSPPSNPSTTCGGGPNDNGTYTITSPTATTAGSIVVLFNDVHKFMPAGDVNVRFASGLTLGWHFDNYPNGNLNDKTFKQLPSVPIISNGGQSLTIILPLGYGKVTWVQVASFNTHAGTDACPLPA